MLPGAPTTQLLLPSSSASATPVSPPSPLAPPSPSTTFTRTQGPLDAAGLAAVAAVEAQADQLRSAVAALAVSEWVTHPALDASTLRAE
jgi:hypothetical protein